MMKNKLLWIVSAAVVALAVVFAFTDWQISQTVYNPAAGWARFLEAYGQLPGSFLGFVCGAILLRTYKVEKKVKSIAGVVGLFLLTAFAAFGFFADAFGAQVDQNSVNLPMVAVSTIAALIITQVVLSRFQPETLNRYKPAAKVGLAVMFVGAILTVWVIKIPWGRWTYRDILEAGNPGLFTPWYLPQGNNGHHSFFSGHTAFAFAVLPLILFLRKGSRARKIVLSLILFWGILVAASRVVVGAHFASDVLAGAADMLIWFLVFQRAYFPEKDQ